MCYFSSFFSSTNTHTHIEYNLPDKREKKRAIQTQQRKMSLNLFLFLGGFFLVYFSGLHNRISLCVFCTQFTHTKTAAHIFPLSKSNAWRKKIPISFQAIYSRSCTQSKIILSFATMCACVWLNETHEVQENNEQTKKKNRMKERKKGKWSRRQQHQHWKQQIR